MDTLLSACLLRPWLLVVITGISALYFLLFRETRSSKMMRRIPGPPPLPLFGNVLSLNGPSEHLLGILQKWTEQYGKRFKIRIGFSPRLAVMNHRDTEKILNSQVHINKSKDYDFLFPWLGTGLLTSKGEKWFQRRKMLTPTFHFRILDDFLEVFNEQGQTMVQLLANEFGDGEVFNIFPYVTRCALDIISETAMGKKINAQHQTDTEYVKAVYRISDLIQYRQLRPWLHPDLIWSLSPAGREEKDCLRILHDFTTMVIREKKEEFLLKKRTEEKGAAEDENAFTKGKKRLAFLDLLLEAQAKEEPGHNRLTDLDIRMETDTFMFEGHDTTAANVNWTIFLLACYPEFQAKVHEELERIFGDDRDRSVTTTDMTQMKYLECCIKESLRLYPSVPFIARVIMEDLKLDDEVTIPKGTIAMLLQFQLHRDAEIFPDPELFLPDRFLPENAVGRPAFAYVPFSAGPRNCIGQKFAMMEEKVLLSQFFRTFSAKAAERREQLILLPELILRPKNGLHIAIKPRRRSREPHMDYDKSK